MNFGQTLYLYKPDILQREGDPLGGILTEYLFHKADRVSNYIGIYGAIWPLLCTTA